MMLHGVIFAFAFAALCGLGITLRDYQRQRQLRSQRHGASEAVFLRHFTDVGADERVTRTVYRTLQSEKLARGVPVLPADDLDGVHGIDREELDYLAADLAKTLGRRFPGPEAATVGEPVKTVEDLVKYLDSLPKLPHEEQAH
jgi:hypothetical protein